MTEFELDLENLRINEDVKKGALAGNAVDIMHCNLRAMSILGFRINQNIEETEKLLVKVGLLDDDVKQVKRTVKNHSIRIRKLEEKVEGIEKQIA